MRIDEACVSMFARHETFHLRYGWLKKAYDAVSQDPMMFVRESATVELGVGKNMVRAIRFWGRAARVVSGGASTAIPRLAQSRPSRIGHTLLADDGWDPYCENPATLWLLHWWLLAPKSLLPVWWAAFHAFPAVEFEEDHLRDFIIDHVRAVPEWQPPHESSLVKDVSCLLRTYSVVEERKQRLEDVLDCPFRDLGLLRRVPGQPRRLRFSIGPKPTLPPAVVLFTSLDFVARTQGDTSRTVILSRLATEPGGPGRAFRLSESSFIQAIESAVQGLPDIRLAAPAGVTQLQFDDDPALLATRVLCRYYRPGLNWIGEILAGHEADLPSERRTVAEVSI